VRDAGVAGSNPATPTIISIIYIFEVAEAQRNASSAALKVSASVDGLTLRPLWYATLGSILLHSPALGCQSGKERNRSGRWPRRRLRRPLGLRKASAVA